MRIFIVAALIAASLAAPLWAQPAAPLRVPSNNGLFTPLKVGQKVTLKESFGQWEISLLNAGELGSHTIVEIYPTHLVLTDVGRLTLLWVPATAVKAVSWMRLPDGSGPRP